MDDAFMKSVNGMSSKTKTCSYILLTIFLLIGVDKLKLLYIDMYNNIICNIPRLCNE